MKSYTNVINAAGLEAWKAANLNKATEEAGRVLFVTVQNCRDLYCMFEALQNQCSKAWKKYAGLDLSYLSNCSIMKSITRAARKWCARFGEFHTMQEDAAARILLALDIFDTCKYLNK